MGIHLDSRRLDELLSAFPRGRVLVVGDMIADEYLAGEVARISREAPVLILHHRESRVFPGGGSNAAANLASLGAAVDMAGLVGTDLMAGQLCEALNLRNVGTKLAVADPARPTTTKTRISASSQQSVNQQIVRIDRECTDPIPEELAAKLVEDIVSRMGSYDAILLSDYGNGVLTPRVIEPLMAEAKRLGKVVAVDTQGDLGKFPGAWVLTPNQPEAEAVVGFPIVDAASLRRAGETLVERANAKTVLITRGGRGMALFEADGGLTEIPAFNQSEVFDVTGAGDTVFATLTLALATGATPVEAMILANLAASIVVRRFGTSVTTPEEMRAAWDGLPLRDVLPGANL